MTRVKRLVLLLVLRVGNGYMKCQMISSRPWATPMGKQHGLCVVDVGDGRASARVHSVGPRPLGAGGRARAFPCVPRAKQQGFLPQSRLPLGAP